MIKMSLLAINKFIFQCMSHVVGYMYDQQIHCLIDNIYQYEHIYNKWSWPLIIQTTTYTNNMINNCETEKDTIKTV